MIDLHPISVHFPIALLTLYTVVQLLPPKITWRNTTLFTLNSFLLLIGSAGLLVARQLGDQLERTHQDIAQLVYMHSAWATYATALYGIMTIVYFLLILKKLLDRKVIQGAMREFVGYASPVILVAKFLFDYYFVTALALIGFVLIMITGALGGAIVYGSTADPIISFVYSWLVR